MYACLSESYVRSIFALLWWSRKEPAWVRHSGLVTWLTWLTWFSRGTFALISPSVFVNFFFEFDPFFENDCSSGLWFLRLTLWRRLAIPAGEKREKASTMDIWTLLDINGILDSHEDSGGWWSLLALALVIIVLCKVNAFSWIFIIGNKFCYYYDSMTTTNC